MPRNRYEYQPKPGTGIQHLKERIDKGLWPAVQELKKRVEVLERQMTERQPKEAKE